MFELAISAHTLAAIVTLALSVSAALGLLFMPGMNMSKKERMMLAIILYFIPQLGAEIPMVYFWMQISTSGENMMTHLEEEEVITKFNHYLLLAGCATASLFYYLLMYNLKAV